MDEEEFARIITIPQCSYRFSKGNIQCSEPAIEGSNFCLFHDPNAWETQESELLDIIEGKIFWQDFNFEGYHFPEIDFFKFTFQIPVNFQNATFHSSARFTSASFNEANFRGAKFLGRAYFNKCQFSGDAFFDEAEFLERAFFRRTHFQDAKFTKVKFSERTFFQNSQFINGFFSHGNFLNHVNFNGSIFNNAFFRGAKFSGTNFRNVKFSGRVTFRKSNFREAASFSRAVFSGKSNFKNVHFLKIAAFSNTHFLDQTDFTDSKFTIAEFENAKFSESVRFINSCKINADGTHTFWHANFTNAIFEKNVSFKNAYLDPCFESTSVNFSNFRDTKWPKGKTLSVERRANDKENGILKMIRYQNAVRTYFFLRKALNNEGDFVDESDFFYRERLTQRKLLGTRRHLQFNKLTDGQKEEVIGLCGGLGQEYILEWIWLWIAGWTCGFGERILLVVRTFFFTLFFFALIFLIDMSSCPQTILKCLPDALYVSVGALSNMGVDVNDLVYPLSMCGMWFVQIEALTGIILTSLFLVTFVRKMSRQ